MGKRKHAFQVGGTRSDLTATTLALSVRRDNNKMEEGGGGGGLAMTYACAWRGGLNIILYCTWSGTKMRRGGILTRHRKTDVLYINNPPF